MYRCLELARQAAGYTAPNPMVGAVLVHEDRIIGEGYHRLYGQAHAEVNAIASVQTSEEHLIPASTIYVSLEPCAHFGKTPPCADLIIAKRIPRVVVGCRDPFPLVDGKGIEKLRAAGVSVEVGVLEKECVELNKRFFTFNTKQRPYIVLKWAQSGNGKIATLRASGAVEGSGAGSLAERDAPKTGGQEAADIAAGAGGTAGSALNNGRLLITNEYTNRLVHRWRSEEAAIMVGTGTALADDPSLTVRHWTGPSPVRLVIDATLRLPRSLQLFDGTVKTIVFNTLRHAEEGNIIYYQLATDSSMVRQIVMALYRLKIQSVLIEGGTLLLQSFIDEGYWDEARVITNEDMQVADGLAAPVLGGVNRDRYERLYTDRIDHYRNPVLG